jgi:hypothetical protein
VSIIRQLSLFGAGAAPPEPADLAGLLLAGGEISRNGETAQISIVVHHPWRAAAIVSECARRAVAATVVSAGDSPVGVRTAFAAALAPLARAWTDDLGRHPPRTLTLGGAVLRLWAMAVGHRDGAGYVLAISESDQGFPDVVGAALARLGVSAQLVSRRGGTGEMFRIVGRRRLDRLAEMVGDPPKQAPPDIWPS